MCMPNMIMHILFEVSVYTAMGVIVQLVARRPYFMHTCMLGFSYLKTREVWPDKLNLYHTFPMEYITL